MKKTIILFIINLFALLFMFDSIAIAQSIKNGKVVIDFTSRTNEKKLKSSAVINQSSTYGIEIDSKLQSETLLSDVIKVPLEKAEPFLGVGLIMNHTKNGGSFAIKIRNSVDKVTWSEWENIEEMDLVEMNTETYRSELLFMDKLVQYIQFKIVLNKADKRFTAIKGISLSFISPGATPKDVIKKNIEESKKVTKSTSTLKAYARPAYVDRAGWNCPQAENTTARTLTTVTHLILHHSAANTTSSDFAAVVRSYWDWHVNSNGWDDIGYNWLMDGNGVIYKGRAWYSSTQENVLGAHNSSQNGGTSGICYIGDYTTGSPTSALWNSSYKLLAFLCDKFGLNPTGTAYHAAIGRVNDIIDGHKDSGGGTTCPANVAIDYATIRNSVVDELVGTPTGPTNLSTSVAACPSGDVTFNWTNSGSGWQIHVSTNSDFSSYHLKWVSTLTSYTGPAGFVDNSTGADLGSFQEGITYYWRMYYDGSYTSTQSFLTHTCVDPITTIDDFEVSVGHFDKYPTYSGTTIGISSASTLARVTTTAYGGIGSLQAVLYDNTSVSTNWKVRLLSGSGSPANNVPIASSGTLELWVKTSTAASGATIQLWIDDNDGLEASPAITINNDGTWHQYTWDLANYGGTTITTGNGELDAASVTLDAIVLSQPNTAATWTLNIDNVEHNAYGISTQLKNLNEVEKITYANQEGSNVVIYPNPSPGLFTVDFRDQKIAGFELEIKNTTGAKVFAAKSNSNRKLIDTGNLPAGLYFVLIKTKDFSKTLKLLIK